MWAVAIAHDGGRLGARRSPRPTSSGCSPTPRSRTPASSWSASSALDRGTGLVRRRCSTCSPTASPRSAPSRSSPWCATPDGEATHLSQWAGLGQALAAGRRRCSRCSCCALAGIPLTSGFTGKFAVFTRRARRRRRPAGRRRRGRQRGGGVLLPPGHRADVLLRAGRRRPDRRGARRLHHRRASPLGVAVTVRARRRPAAGARPGRAGAFVADRERDEPSERRDAGRSASASTTRRSRRALRARAGRGRGSCCATR